MSACGHFNEPDPAGLVLCFNEPDPAGLTPQVFFDLAGFDPKGSNISGTRSEPINF